MLAIAPHVQLVDLSHQVAPQNIMEAAFLLARSVPFFSRQTIHLVVVDPGVGTQRRGMAARIGDYYFVGPDNGLITLIYQASSAHQAETLLYELENPAFQLQSVSHTFHGRDIFAPAAAHIANGVSLHEFGKQISKPVLLELPKVKQEKQKLIGTIVHCDSFGNVASNIRQEHLPDGVQVRVNIRDRKNFPLVNTFAEAKDGDIVAFFDSFGYLAVAIVNGSASQKLGIGVGEKIIVRRI